VQPFTTTNNKFSLKSRGVKWEVLSNAGAQGLLGAVIVVKEKNLEDAYFKHFY
jgi:hypothetical protein